MPNKGNPIYPKKILLLKPDEEYTIPKIAGICSVSERTVFRWINSDYLEKTGVNTYQVFAANIPKNFAKSENKVLRKYTADELEDFYVKILSGELEAQINIAEVLRGEHGTDIRVLRSLMQGLDDYRELIDYVIER